MAQIFEVARLHGIKVLGVASTTDHNVTALYFETPSPRMYGDTEEPGQLSARRAIMLGRLLVDLGEAMLAGDLRHDANKG